jgi:hypothetical protein
MILKLYILQDDKLLLNKFILSHNNNQLILHNTSSIDLIKIPIYNIYNGILYINIKLPIIFNIIDDKIFNPYIILSSYSLDNDIDFFSNLKNIIFDKYNLKFINITDNFDIINMYKIDILDIDINTICYNINVIKTIFILCNIKSYKYPENYYKLLETFKYKLFINSNLLLCLKDYLNYDFNKPLKNNSIKINKSYYILQNQIIKNIVITHKNYICYNHNPHINIDNDYIIFNTFINTDINQYIINNIINLNSNVIKYYDNYKLSYLRYKYNDMYILKHNSYDNIYFIDLIKKYTDIKSIINIYQILFSNYIYPLKSNKNELDDIFDQILYISLYNNKTILSYNNNDILIIEAINKLIPIKLKSLYINTLRILINIIQYDINYVIMNHKFFNDILHRNIIKLFLTDNNKISITLFKSLIPEYIFNNFKNIITNNLLLIDLSYKLSWNNISKRLYYLKLFFNNNILHYESNNNKNILSCNLDNKIKKIIKNPFEMYKYLKNEKDFIIWTKIITDRIITIYYIPICIEYDDIIFIAKIIYLLFNVNTQNLKDVSYINFIKYCNLHKNLIINCNRINIKIKECFPTLKLNINLGVLTKHILWNKDIIIIQDDKLNYIKLNYLDTYKYIIGL